ncbi:Dbl homology domain-containing protein [Gamsiella multidivaricata]|uniref:Dbl homology domain-containing protein n=1 Tax=Gamsiella multidivaricata TaxID=101098 RepID=UPI00222124A9|nr:Dbl homology domain-containing protein [Gamsiella multidivaricata]KAI7817356.1 Dbl homology domain-containing protein [Gamsiella multidivaricata]
MIGTIFLDVKDSLSIFLKYGQSYGKGMKALRTLMKSKRTSISAAPFFSPVISPTDISSKAPMAGGPRMDKRRSLPAIFSLNSAPGAPSSALLESTGSKSNTGSDQANVGKSNTGYTSRSNHGTLTTIGEFSEYQHFLRNCVGGKETTSRFSLTDLLILPIQRVTRYCLLLKDLKKHTDVEHQDYICIVHALEQLHTLALATNNVQPLSMRQ